MLDRSPADVEALRDLGVREPFGQERQDFSLALGQRPVPLRERPRRGSELAQHDRRRISVPGRAKALERVKRVPRLFDRCCRRVRGERARQRDPGLRGFEGQAEPGEQLQRRLEVCARLLVSSSGSDRAAGEPWRRRASGRPGGRQQERSAGQASLPQRRGRPVRAAPRRARRARARNPDRSAACLSRHKRPRSPARARSPRANAILASNRLALACQSKPSSRRSASSNRPCRTRRSASRSSANSCDAQLVSRLRTHRADVPTRELSDPPERAPSRLDQASSWTTNAAGAWGSSRSEAARAPVRDATAADVPLRNPQRERWRPPGRERAWHPAARHNPRPRATVVRVDDDAIRSLLSSPGPSSPQRRHRDRAGRGHGRGC